MLQGSVLSHILFVVYIKEICFAGFCSYSNANIKQDYSQMLTNFISVSMFHLSTCFIDASTILYEGQLKSSSNNCIVLILWCIHYNNSIGDVLLPTIYSITDPGVITDSRMTFKLHIHIIRGRARANQRAAMMLRTFYLRGAYQLMLDPSLSIALQFWRHIWLNMLTKSKMCKDISPINAWLQAWTIFRTP